MIPNFWPRWKYLGQVPRNWERAFGYDGSARWLMVYWSPWGDEAVFSDGFLTEDGAWWVFQELIETLPLLKEEQWSLGTSDTEPTHCLLFDLWQRKIYYASWEQAWQLVHSQWASFPVISEEDLLQMLDEIASAFKPNRELRLCQTCKGMGWFKVEDGYDPCPECKGVGWLPIEENSAGDGS